MLPLTLCLWLCTRGGSKGGKGKLHAEDLGLLDDAGTEGEAIYVKIEQGDAEA